MHWNSKGTKGSRGPAGPTGAAGPAGQPGAAAGAAFGLKTTNRAELACDTSETAPFCPQALTPTSSVVLFQNDFVVVKGSCYGTTDPDPTIQPDLSRSTAQITVQTVRPTQQNLFISYFTVGLDPLYTDQLITAQVIGSSSVPFRIDNRRTTANSSDKKDVWGGFLQLTIIDGQTAGSEKGMTATIIPFANFSSGCRFLGTTTAL